jgi:hypothetical protein
MRECNFPVALLETVGVASVMPFVFGLALLSDGTIWVQRSLPSERPAVLDVFGSDGAYVGTARGMSLPVGRLPNGDILVPVPDEASGGQHLMRVRIVR